MHSDPNTQNYVEWTIDHVSFVELLAKQNGKQLIDLLIMDVEGAEFGILPLLFSRDFEYNVYATVALQSAQKTYQRSAS